MSNRNVRQSLAPGLMFVMILVLAACAPIGSAPAQATSAAPATAVAPAPAASAPAAPAPSPNTAGATVVPATVAATVVPTAQAATAGAMVTTAPAISATPPATSASSAAATPASAAALPAPVCTPGTLTPALTEGPYYKASPPANASLLTPGMSGTELTISGYVLDANCKPIANARVDFWQADSEGQYDNTGYTLRGYQMSDANGRYTVATVVPGLYPGRTRHIHVKVTPPGGTTLTTQLFFPNEAQNARDGIFAAQNVMRIQNNAGAETATFDFVVRTG